MITENDSDLFYLDLLQLEFKKRKDKNPSYSLRAFAMNLDIDSSLLSKILNNKILPTLEIAHKICNNLKLNSERSKEFMKSIADEKLCIELHKLNPEYTDCDL